MSRLFLLLTLVCCTGLSMSDRAVAATWWQAGPAAVPVAELPMDLEQAKELWDVGTGMNVVDDEILRRPVIEHTGRGLGVLRTKAPLVGTCELTALVRITEEKASGHTATLCLGVTGDSEPGDAAYSLGAASYPQTGRFNLRLTPAFGSGATSVYQDSGPMRSDPVRIHWPRSVTVGDRYPTISPVWDPALRREIEAGMAQVPLVHESWFRLRIEHGRDAVRLYQDGRLVAERRPPGRVEGDAALWLRGNVRVAELTIRHTGERPGGFYPVPIGNVCNARAAGAGGPAGLRADSLPPAGVPVSVERVPFVLAERGADDHVDVGTSLFHYRNQDGFFSARTTWPRPGQLDPARILLSVPNRPYARLWLIAASDDRPNHVPVVCARFYRPQAGFAIDAEADVPALSAQSGPESARRLPITLANGKPGSLWLVPIELDPVAIGSQFRDEMTLSIELTKRVYDYRAYPDPAAYDRFQGGLPSSVRIFAVTLEEAPLRLIASGNRAGNVYVSPEEPVWNVEVDSHRRQALPVQVRVTVTDPGGEHRVVQTNGEVGPQMTAVFELPLSTATFGLHRVLTEVEAAGRTFSQEGTFVQLPYDTRRATAADSRWGLWWWRGGHLTNPNEEESLYLLRAAGTRVAGAKDLATRRRWGMVPNPRILVRSPEKWAYKDPYDPKEYARFSEEIGRKAAEQLLQSPDIQYFPLFGENSISLPLTYGVLPRYIGEPEYVLNDQEKARLRASIITAKAATEGIRKHAPGAKVCFGWCEPTFSVPFMRAGYSKELMDAIGCDSPQFERPPEMPIRSVAPNRMWILQQERKRLGYDDVPVIHTESYFPTSHRLALGPRGSADHYVRTSVLSLALGTTRLMWCFTLHDCADYWGSTHYGCIGVIGRRPEYNPKPAFPAYATMTRLLDRVEYDGYVPTGSLTAYCVRFKGSGQLIHCLWTVRGRRDATLSVADSDGVVQVDENGNEAPLEPADGAVTVRLSPTPIWVVSRGPVEKIEPGPATHDEKPPKHTVELDPLDQPWTYEPGAYERYATNHWDLPRFPGSMQSEAVESPERGGAVWQITLDEPGKERKLAAFYGVFRPKAPIAIPGKAAALGVWARGQSNWGRIIYEIEDARGEVWQSIGAKDAWNCDDTHCWSYFNFDGWRYLEFPLPGHLAGDGYRQKDTVWWNHSAEGVVDLPIKLTRIIIEHRTHNVYVNDCLPVADRSVQLDRLLAAYPDAEAMTDAPVRLQRAAAGAVQAPSASGTALRNPITVLKEDGTGAPAAIAKVAPPEERHDGTRIMVGVRPVSGAVEYRVYVSAYADGAGAEMMAQGEEPELLVTKLRPEVPLYLFATYLDAERRESPPSPARRVLLKDEFPMK